MPDAFAKLFEKLDSAPKPKPLVKTSLEKKPGLRTGQFRTPVP
jgi:hypothetical protein